MPGRLIQRSVAPVREPAAGSPGGGSLKRGPVWLGLQFKICPDVCRRVAHKICVGWEICPERSTPGSQEQPQDVPEQEGHRSEQGQGRRDVLADAVMMQHVGRVVQDVAAGQGDHRVREDRPQ